MPLKQGINYQCFSLIGAATIITVMCITCSSSAAPASLSHSDLKSSESPDLAPTTLLLLKRANNLPLLQERLYSNSNNQQAHYLRKRSESKEDSFEASPKYKQAMKKKWHKLVDEIIDDQLDESKKPEFSKKKSKWNKSPSEDNNDDDNEKIVIIMKKKPINVENNSQAAMNAMSSNLVGLQVTGGDLAATGRKMPEEHHRRILNDQFGIMKDAIFTTNNHLGFKGVPKFGSEEEY